MKRLSILPLFDSISFDARLKKTFMLAVNTVQQGSAVCLTAIGRQLSQYTKTSEKHAIKRADRLIGNKVLQSHRLDFYRQACQLFANQKHPLIMVDWTHLHDNSRALLRASIAFDGRAFTVYEEVYAERSMNSNKSHKVFLKGLKAVLPPDCCPIICTDAGFKVPWIKEVESYNWYWLARIRGTVQCSIDKGKHWVTLSHFYKTANTKAKAIPSFWLSKAAQHECRGVLYRCAYPPKPKKAPKRPNCNDYKKHLKSSKDPWLLATNVPESILDTKDIVNAYRRRMTIEEAFRDSKNEYYGLGLRRSRSQDIDRLQTLLLILLVAQWQLYLIGRAAENKGIHLQFQANTITSRRVLSYCYLARRVLLHARYTITEKQLQTALHELIQLTKIGRTCGES